MSVPGVGPKVAEKILELREAKGDLELEDLKHVPYIRLTPPLLRCLDFSPFDEGLLDYRHREHEERVKSVDKLVEGWSGVHPQGIGKSWGQLGRGPPEGLKQKWNGGKGHSHLRGLRKILMNWIPCLWNRLTHGERKRDSLRVHVGIKMIQIRDNRSRHQFGERVVMILRKKIGHICMNFRTSISV